MLAARVCRLVVAPAFLLCLTAVAHSAPPESAAGVSGAVAPAFAPIDLSGSWSGSWHSTTNRHRGPLFAEFCKVSEMAYRVNFRGRFFRIFPFRYSVTLNVVEIGPDHVVLAGTSYLGRMFGTFTYSATATSTHFVANYSSCKYLGQFNLSRCCQ